MKKNLDLDRTIYYLDGWITRKDTYRNFIKYLASNMCSGLTNYTISNDNSENQFDIYHTRNNPYENVLIASHKNYEEADNHIVKLLEIEVYSNDISTYRNIHHWETREEIPDFLNKGKHLD